MVTITIEIPDDLPEQLAQLGNSLPELLQQCVQQAIFSSMFTLGGDRIQGRDSGILFNKTRNLYWS
ncbi:hypothetical protein NDA03_25485 [Trichocoleus sp. Lan]|uniref:hypothetical protein n=1 Tax=Trichocoleus sp. Lan TaxID=2933927 RepID=UPI003299042C